MDSANQLVPHSCHFCQCFVLDVAQNGDLHSTDPEKEVWSWSEPLKGTSDVDKGSYISPHYYKLNLRPEDLLPIPALTCAFAEIFDANRDRWSYQYENGKAHFGARGSLRHGRVSLGIIEEEEGHRQAGIDDACDQTLTFVPLAIFDVVKLQGKYHVSISFPSRAIKHYPPS